MESDKNVEILKVPPYIGVPEMRTYFALSKKKARSLLRRREIEGKRDGKYWIACTASIVRYLKKNSNRRITL